MLAESRTGWDRQARRFAGLRILNSFSRVLECRLLDRAADLRKHGVRIRSDEPDRAHNDHQNHSQHDCVFRNVLTTLIVPELM